MLGHWACSSKKVICLVRTVSHAGTCANKMGLRDNVSIAGSESDECGWALLKDKRHRYGAVVELTYEERLGKAISQPESLTRSHLLLSAPRS